MTNYLKIADGVVIEDYNKIAETMKMFAELARTGGLSTNHIETHMENYKYKYLFSQVVSGSISDEGFSYPLSKMKSITVDDIIAMGAYLLFCGCRPEEIRFFISAVGKMQNIANRSKL